MDKTIFSFPCQLLYQGARIDLTILTQIGSAGIVKYKTSSDRPEFNGLRIERASEALTKFHILDTRFTRDETVELERQLTEILRKMHNLE